MEFVPFGKAKLEIITLNPPGSPFNLTTQSKFIKNLQEFQNKYFKNSDNYQ